MSGNITIRPSVTVIDDQIVESYERITNASKEQVEAAGLDAGKPQWAKIGVTSINEYVQLIFSNVKAGTSQQIKIGDLGQELEIDNLFVKKGSQGSFDIEIYTARGVQIFDLTVIGNKEAIEMPNTILTKDLNLRIRAREDVPIVIFNCRPAVLLKKAYAKPVSNGRE